MKCSFTMMKALRLGASILSLALPVNTFAGTVTVVSDSSWNVYDSDPINPNWLGLSQNVCLNSTNPSNCPLGATPAPTLYGYSARGWTADLSSLSTSVTWIWAPEITGTSSPAASQEFTFDKEFYVCDAPQDGTIYLAADDSAEISINGTAVPNSSRTSPDQVTTITVPASLIYGSSMVPPTPTIRANHITVRAKNGISPRACHRSDKYSCNPAGVALVASFKFKGNPTCTGFISSNGTRTTYENGQKEHLHDCPSSQVGEIYHLCVCGGWTPNINTCITPPPTCASNGVSHNLGDSEQISCPTGQIGTASRICIAKDTWGAPDFSNCTLPPANPGELCGDKIPGQVMSCPDGTMCTHRMSTPGYKPPAWCTVCGIFTLGLCTLADVCHATPPTWTSDWFCLSV